MAALPRSVLVTGANRGIGFEIVKQLTCADSHPRYVFATHRAPLGGAGTVALEELAGRHGHLHLVQLDLNDESTVKQAAIAVGSIVGDEGLNVLVNNAATLKEETSLEKVTIDDMMKHFRINSVGPMLMTQAMLPHLRRAADLNSSMEMSWCRAAIFHISSYSGSVTTPEPLWRMYAYKASKAALNMFGATMCDELTPMGIGTSMLCPGWVQTDMGGPEASITAETSAQGLLKMMAKFDSSRNRSFYNYRGSKIDW